MPRRQRFVLIAVSGIAGLLMLAMLAAPLVTVERQRQIAARQEQRVQNFLRIAAPTTTRARDSQRAVMSGLARADDLVRRLRRLDTPEAIAAAGEIAGALEATDAPRSIAAAGSIARKLERSGA